MNKRYNIDCNLIEAFNNFDVTYYQCAKINLELSSNKLNGDFKQNYSNEFKQI